MKRKCLDIPANYVAFEDIESSGTIYCMTPENCQRAWEIQVRYADDVSAIPAEELIEVYPIEFAESIDAFNDKYRLRENGLQRFPIKRIRWIFVQIINL